jgi:hypothetical protein
VVIGLVASSSFALAEGKFAYRQPLQGVNANPTFGMSQSQIDEANKIEADKAMCLNEETYETEVVTYHKGSTSTWFTMDTNPDGTLTSSGVFNGISVLNGQKQWWYMGRAISRTTSNSVNYGDSTFKQGAKGGEYYGGGCECWVPVYKIIEETPATTTISTKTEKTENYDYCVDKGYPTAN